MRKSIYLAAVAVLVVFGLTGCDRVLEVFYPEFAPQESEFDLSIHTKIEVPGAGEFTEATAVVHDLDSDENYRQVQPIWYEYAGEKGTPAYFAEFYIDGIPSGAYRVEIFVDESGDYEWDRIDEPGTDLLYVFEGAGEPVPSETIVVDDSDEFIVISADAVIGE